MKLINFFIEDSTLAALDQVVAEHLWSSRSAFIREAIVEKLARTQVTEGALPKLRKVLEEFDDKYLECWRDEEKTRELVLEIEALKSSLPATISDAQIAKLEQAAKLLPDARARTFGEQYEIARLRQMFKLREARNLASLRGQDTSVLDSLLEFLESTRTNAKD